MSPAPPRSRRAGVVTGAPGAIDVDIVAIDASGDGIARIAGQAVAVPFTIPGERVRVRLGRRAGTPTATLVEVIRASPHRIVPRCPHFGPSPERPPCGGCAWQHIAYPEQLRLKTDLVTRLVRGQVPSAPAARPMRAGTPLHDPWGYRNKVHFVFAGARMGHYARGSRRVIPVHECRVHDERGNRVAFALRDALDRSPRFHPEQGALRSVAVRVGVNSHEVMATIVAADDRDKSLRAATRRLIASPDAPTSVHLNLHPRDDGFIFGRQTRRISGPDRLREEVAGISFLMSPTAFFQTNVRAAEILVGLVVAAVPAGAPVIDLYAGAGLFALPLARAGHAVVAIEENRAAVEDGEASRALNRISLEQCRFTAAQVEPALRRLAAARPQPSPAVVLDPPRAGCEPDVLDLVFAGLRPQAAVYISCNPEALARDLKIVTAHGYRVESLQPVDMFPHTAHVETVAVLSRAGRRVQGAG